MPADAHRPPSKAPRECGKLLEFATERRIVPTVLQPLRDQAPVFANSIKEFFVACVGSPDNGEVLVDVWVSNKNSFAAAGLSDLFPMAVLDVAPH